MARVITDIRKKDTKALNKLLTEKRAELKKLIREKRTTEQKDINVIRKTRQEIARILTVLNESKEEEK